MKGRKTSIGAHGAVSANRLLERPPEESYTEEWTSLLAKPQETAGDTKEIAGVLFRIGREWLVFPALYLAEVTNSKVIHRIPHQRNPIFKGLVNLKGQLRICINMAQLLEINENVPPQKGFHNTYQRMISISKDGNQWIFPVDEVEGIAHFDLESMENVPVTVTKSKVNFLKGVIPQGERKIGFIDEELFFACLERNLL